MNSWPTGGQFCWGAFPVSLLSEWATVRCIHFPNMTISLGKSHSQWTEYYWNLNVVFIVQPLLYVPGKGPCGPGEVRETWLPSKPPQAVQGWSDVLLTLSLTTLCPFEAGTVRKTIFPGRGGWPFSLGLLTWVRVQMLSVKSTELLPRQRGLGYGKSTVHPLKVS